MRLPTLLAAAMVMCFTRANAGITIHFKGSVADDAAIEKIAEVACAEAQKNAWRCTRVVGEEIKSLDSITVKAIAKLDGSADFTKAKGVVVLMHEMSEPLYLVFGSSRQIDNFVKTQFAGADVHIRAVELLEKVKPHFTTLEVHDEGNYWESKDRAMLEKELDGIQAMMAKIKSQRSDAEGPVKRPDGRILDLVRK